jgi:HK97 family phage major capsid protein
MTAGSATNGGALVSESFEDVIMSAIEGANPMRRFCNVIKSPTKVKLPYSTDNQAVELVAEEGAFSAVQPTSTFFETVGFKIGCRVDASVEMVQDYPDLENYIAQSAALQLGLKESDYIWYGTGSGQPKGITAETVANTHTASNVHLKELMYAIEQNGFQDYNIPSECVAFINNKSLPKSFTTSTSFDEIVFQNASGREGIDAYFAYVPLVATTGLKPSGTTDNFWASYGNWRRAFCITDIGDIVIKRDSESQAANGLVNFYVWKRFDCKLINAAAITLNKKSA